MPQNACFIEGRSVSLFEATHAVAALIARSRLPVFLINACDVAGTRAAIRLAACSGGVIDHSESKGEFREIYRDAERSAEARRHGSSRRLRSDEALARYDRKARPCGAAAIGIAAA